MEEIKSAFSKIGIKSTTEEDKNTLFGILKQEHNQVQNNMRQILSENKMNPELFSQTVDALNAHMKGEEDILYPRLEDNPNTRRMAFMSYEEHNLVKQLLSNMSISSTENDRWFARIEILNNLLDEHIKREENQVFPKAKEVLYAQTENEMTTQYLNQKQATT